MNDYLPTDRHAISAPEERSGRVLVVDRDDGVRHLMKHVLEREGFSVTAVATGKDAAALVGASDFDAVVLDLLIHNHEMLTVLTAAADKWPRRKRVVLVSAVGRDRMEAVPSDIVHSLLEKPFEPSEFVKAVRAALVTGVPPAR